MIIQIDSREKERAIKSIVAEFDRRGIMHPISKLIVGDYMNYDNPRIIVDRKQNLNEIAQNVCQDHDRFRRELLKAKEMGIHLIVLIEHGDGIECLEDVIFWDNPRKKVSPKAISGEHLYNILTTLSSKYGVEFQFCTKAQTGKKIIELLEGENDFRGD